MPVSPKTLKRSGAPKAKGAVRAKSGCYTCRIRRKKCDEQANGEGNCQTCVRLKLQCLGFGAKRPEWLRENRNVVELREKIKGFLASQGMIKGHSGSASRIMEHEPSTLRLAGDDGSSSSESSPSTPGPTLMIDEIRSPRGLMTSSERDIPWQSAYNPGQELSPDDPPFGSAVEDGLTPEVMLASYPNTLPPITSSSHSLVSPWPQTTLISYSSPAIMSSFSSSYHQSYPEEDQNELSLPNISVDTFYFPSDNALNLVQYYMDNVLKLQYLLADQPLFTRMMKHSTMTSDVARDAVCLLSSVHRFRIQHRGQGDDSEINERYGALYPLLKKQNIATDDAMAALHIISTLLFIGGTGKWPEWLNVAYVFVDSVFRNSQLSRAEILVACGDDMRYIIKTAMWFDVLASACLFRRPHFLVAYRELFQPPHAHIDNLPTVPQPELSMLSLMGCENHVVWALAEVTELSDWKDNERRHGRLSMPRLVERGLQIEKHILCRPGPSLPPDDDINYHRYVTSDVFRASTRVYLHSVLSGDHPSCPEIVEGVDDTMRCLDRISGCWSNTSRLVVRSVVFSIFICGCLTDDPVKRQYFLDCLVAQEVETVGNCTEIKMLMKVVWADRSTRGLEEPVQWRSYLKNSGILLV